MRLSMPRTSSVISLSVYYCTSTTIFSHHLAESAGVTSVVHFFAPPLEAGFKLLSPTWLSPEIED